MKEKLNDDPLRNLTLKQLHVIAAVAKTGRITAAANVLGVTPPAVTLQVKQLERDAGLLLFERTPVGLRPTDAGQALLDVEARISAVVRDGSERLTELSGLQKGYVRIGAVSTAKYFVPAAVAAFARTYPGLRIEMLVGNRDDVIAAVAALKIDIAIMGTPPHTIDVHQHAIGDHPHVIVARPDHALMARRAVQLRSLAGEIFLVREPGSGTRVLMEKVFQKARLAPAHGMEFGSNETIKQAVIAGLGIAFISAHTVSAELSAGRLAILPVENFPIVRKWYAVRARAKTLQPPALAMWTMLITDGSKFLPDIAIGATG